MAVALAVGMFSGCGRIDADAAAVTVADGEDTVTLGYANFVAKYTQAVYETTYGSSRGGGICGAGTSMGTAIPSRRM
mgnify:CR=1 FL=1